MNKLILIIAIFAFTNLQAQDSQFFPVDATGIPYSIIISSASLNNLSLPDSTEIAVFDDTLCVGTAIYISGGNVQLVAWQGDPTQNLLGFSSGNTMSFKVRLKQGTNYFIENAVPSYSVGDGNFAYGSYSVLDLQVTPTIVGINAISFSDEITIYPNPVINFINIDLKDKTCQKIEFYSTDGKLLYMENYHQKKSEIEIAVGELISEKKSEILIVKCYCKSKVIISKILYMGKP